MTVALSFLRRAHRRFLPPFLWRQTQAEGASRALESSVETHYEKDTPMARFHSLCCRLCFLWVVGHVHRNLYIHAFAPPLSSFVRNYARTQSFDDNFASFADNTIKHTSVVYLSPSGIDEWPQISQAVVFFSTYVALAITTIPTINLIENISKSIGMEQWRRNIIDTSLPILLGLFYTSAIHLLVQGVCVISPFVLNFMWNGRL